MTNDVIPGACDAKHACGVRSGAAAPHEHVRWTCKSDERRELGRAAGTGIQVLKLCRCRDLDSHRPSLRLAFGWLNANLTPRIAASAPLLAGNDRLGEGSRELRTVAN